MGHQNAVSFTTGPQSESHIGTLNRKNATKFSDFGLHGRYLCVWRVDAVVLHVCLHDNKNNNNTVLRANEKKWP